MVLPIFTVSSLDMLWIFYFVLIGIIFNMYTTYNKFAEVGDTYISLLRHRVHGEQAINVIIRFRIENEDGFN